MEKFSSRLPRSQLEKPRSRQPSHSTLSYEHSEIFTKDLVVYRDLKNRASPVNRDHMKRPLEPLSTQVYQWVPANLLLGVTPRWTSTPFRGWDASPSTGIVTINIACEAFLN